MLRIHLFSIFTVKTPRALPALTTLNLLIMKILTQVLRVWFHIWYAMFQLMIVPHTQLTLQHIQPLPVCYGGRVLQGHACVIARVKMNTNVNTT